MASASMAVRLLLLAFGAPKPTADLNFDNLVTDIMSYVVKMEKSTEKAWVSPGVSRWSMPINASTYIHLEEILSTRQEYLR